jgi:hypothetical protein
MSNCTEAWVEWKDSLYYDENKLNNVAFKALRNFRAHRQAKYLQALHQALNLAQAAHDSNVDRWGWTGLVKPKLFEVDGFDDGKQPWSRLKWQGYVTEATLEDIERLSRTANNATLSMSAYNDLIDWYYLDIK